MPSSSAIRLVATCLSPCALNSSRAVFKIRSGVLGPAAGTAAAGLVLQAFNEVDILLSGLAFFHARELFPCLVLGCADKVEESGPFAADIALAPLLEIGIKQKQGVVVGPVLQVVGVPGGLLKPFSQICHRKPPCVNALAVFLARARQAVNGCSLPGAGRSCLTTGAVHDKPVSLKHRHSVSKGCTNELFRNRRHRLYRPQSDRSAAQAQGACVRAGQAWLKSPLQFAGGRALVAKQKPADRRNRCFAPSGAGGFGGRCGKA